jgi:hypothetical protein
MVERIRCFDPPQPRNDVKPMNDVTLANDVGLTSFLRQPSLFCPHGHESKNSVLRKIC